MGVLPVGPPLAPAGPTWLTRVGQRLQPLYRTARQLAFFGRSLARRVLPARAKMDAVPSAPTLARVQAERLLARASERAPALAQAVARVRHPRDMVASLKPKRKLPSVAELRQTLAMLASSEPPQLAQPVAPATPTPVDPYVLLTTSPVETALEAVAESDESMLDDLLFGDSEPGLDTADEQLSEPPAHLPLSHDLLTALSQFAHDTSPGLIEAPDTLPG